ncbi:zinc metalloprotease ZmpC [Streptococcus pneumoniae]|nr:zinc metalloprotease ZmpC [Streptococcus pneumoniae]
MFRKIAYELLAEKGYHKGFLPYVSNQYGAEAFASGSKTFSSWHGRDVALVTDDLVFKKVFNGAPASWVHLLKQKIYNAYLRTTDDFRNSIYK